MPRPAGTHEILPTQPQIAIVAALEREISPLIQTWRVAKKSHANHDFKFFEQENAALICAGIGPQSARRAAEAIIALYSPTIIYSAGFAGALTPGLKIGEIIIPRRVINAADGSRTDTDTDTAAGDQILISFPSVADPEQKAKLHESFAAHAVDMEAAAVAQAAQARGIKFAAIKAISDESGFTLPPMEKFITAHGQFRTAQFAIHASSRPWLWPTLVRLARNSSKASHALCDVLRRVVDDKIVGGKNAASPESVPLEASNHR